MLLVVTIMLAVILIVSSSTLTRTRHRDAEAKSRDFSVPEAAMDAWCEYSWFFFVLASLCISDLLLTSFFFGTLVLFGRRCQPSLANPTLTNQLALKTMLCNICVFTGVSMRYVTLVTVVMMLYSVVLSINVMNDLSYIKYAQPWLRERCDKAGWTLVNGALMRFNFIKMCSTPHSPPHPPTPPRRFA